MLVAFDQIVRKAPIAFPNAARNWSRMPFGSASLCGSMVFTTLPASPWNASGSMTGHGDANSEIEILCELVDQSGKGSAIAASLSAVPPAAIQSDMSPFSGQSGQCSAMSECGPAWRCHSMPQRLTHRFAARIIIICGE